MCPVEVQFTKAKKVILPEQIIPGPQKDKLYSQKHIFGVI